MNKPVLILFIWLLIGAAAVGLRGYYDSPGIGCSKAATMTITIAAGPLNFIGVNPQISCSAPDIGK